MNTLRLKIALIVLTLFSYIHADTKKIILDDSSLLEMVTPKNNKASDKSVDVVDAEGIIILVHGTFASDTDWYLPDGKFLRAVEIEANKKNYKVVSFTWSGDLNNTARIRAAKHLAQLILTYPEKVKIEVVGHSHGGNVINLASALLYNPIEDTARKHDTQEIIKPFETEEKDQYQTVLAMIADLEQELIQMEAHINSIQKPKPQTTSYYYSPHYPYTLQDKESAQKLLLELKTAYQEVQDLLKTKNIVSGKTKNLIDCAYLLATPVNTKAWPPNYFVIKNLKNFYSTGDLIQTVVGTCDRIYPAHPQLVNLRIQTAKTAYTHSKDNPGHSDIHVPFIGRWLLDIFENLKTLNVGNFDQCNYGMNGKITFHEDYSFPRFETVLDPLKSE